jgi:alpha-N-arabinofuranosidase
VDEFIRWTRLAGVEPMMAVNLGTRGVQEALDLLEYCNVPGGTHYSDARRANGALEPYRVKLWCLGNEMDGPWQIGGQTAHEYGRLASRTAKAMRMIDPGLQLVICGSSSSAMPTFGSWERTVLTEAYDDVDFISAHAYYWEEDGDLASFLASAVDMDYFIDSVVATCDHVRAVRRATKPIMVSFDEWNVWYQHRAESQPPTGDDWPVAPILLEDHYNVADAVVVGSLLISLLKHSDRVQAACLAQLVNVIAPIMTEPGGRLWKQTSFHPFALTARHAKGEVLSVPIECASQDTARYGDVPVIDATATFDPESREAAVFIVNRSISEPVDMRLSLKGLGQARVVQSVLLSSPNHSWQASADDDRTVRPTELPTRQDGHGVAVTLPPVSWAMLRLAS